MADYICLLFDADGIVRATDTIVAGAPDDALARARALLDIMTGLTTFELWHQGRRIAQESRPRTSA